LAKMPLAAMSGTMQNFWWHHCVAGGRYSSMAC
jgi:hypothetical protein